MAIKTGRYGKVLYDPTGVGPAVDAIASLNAWKLSLKTEKEDVTCFGANNRVYCPGLKDVQGTLGGFWDSSDITLFEAADAPTPGLLELMPNDTETTFFWSGLAYMDADIDASGLKVPKVSGTFMAAGDWTGPTATP
jgi:hypothetical protein